MTQRWQWRTIEEGQLGNKTPYAIQIDEATGEKRKIAYGAGYVAWLDMETNKIVDIIAFSSATSIMKERKGEEASEAVFGPAGPYTR